jgi:hypothetical protein
MSYGVDLADTLRGAASYVDRIFRGAKPDEVPVQLPTKFELIINLKSAKELGVDIPPSLMARGRWPKSAFDPSGPDHCPRRRSPRSAGDAHAIRH